MQTKSQMQPLVMEDDLVGEGEASHALPGGGEAGIGGLLEKRDGIVWLDSSSIGFVHVVARGGRCFLGGEMRKLLEIVLPKVVGPTLVSRFLRMQGGKLLGKA
jgi:hypothetical protein